MLVEPPVDPLKSEVTENKPRDEEGHFINIPKITPTKSVLDNFLLSHTGNYKSQDDLLDIKIGNPLGKIVKLLEEIKKQKAFSFTLKGSLGIAGVVLTLSVFGLFGGSQIICDKGIQTHIGVVRILNAREIYTPSVPMLSFVLDLIAPPQKLIKNRIILIKQDNSTIYLPFKEAVDISKYNNNNVITTGRFNSCTQTLDIADITDIETLLK